MTLVEALRGARRAVLDTMVLIYYFEDADTYGDRAASVIHGASTEVFEAVITPVTAAELLVKPLRAKRPDIADRYRSAMAHLDNTSLCSLSWNTGCMAGALRARYGLPSTGHVPDRPGHGDRFLRLDHQRPGPFVRWRKCRSCCSTICRSEHAAAYWLDAAWRNRLPFRGSLMDVMPYYGLVIALARKVHRTAPE